MQFVGKGQSAHATKLLEIIDEDQLPKQFGGKARGFLWPDETIAQKEKGEL